MTSDLPAVEAESQVRLCLNMIVKNETAIIERCLRSALPVLDYYVICDTGSTDDTPAKIRAFFDAHGIAGEIRRIRFKDFEYSRNRALELCRASKADFDYILLSDADMELVVEDPGFKHALSAPAYLVRQSNVLSYFNVRLVRRDTPARYVGVTHEYLAIDGETQPLPRGIWFRDHACGSSRTKKFERDIRLLRAALCREPDNARAMFYLAQSYRDAGKPKQALEWYEKRCAAGGWAEETWYAKYMVAMCHKRMGDDAGFIKHALEAYALRPHRAEPLYWVAQHLRQTGQHESCMLLCEALEQLPYPHEDRLFVEDQIYATGILEEESISGFYCAADSRKEKGYRACIELTNCRDAPEATRTTAVSNSAYYAKRAAELFGEVAIEELKLTDVPRAAPFNPSIWSGGGQIYCVCRTANYTLEDSGNYTIHDPDRVIRTQNYFLTLDHDLKVRAQHRMVDRAPGPQRFRYPVRGFEDCRLFGCKGKLWCTCTVRDREPSGMCEIAVLELDAAYDVVSTHVQRGIWSDRHQKNWVPLVADDELNFVYTTDPTNILAFDFASMSSEFVKAHTPPLSMELFRGGSQALEVEGGWIYLAHESIYHENTGKRTYLHRFVQLDEQLEVLSCSEPFVFLDKGIEFCAGLARHPTSGKLIASFGSGDRRAFLATFAEDPVLRHLAERRP